MSRIVDEKRYKSGNGSVPVATPFKKKGGTLITFSPTKEDKERLKSGVLDETKSLEVLDRAVISGNKISLGFSQDRHGFFAIVREGGASYEEAVGVSCWGSTLVRAVVLLGYYLREINPDFPEGAQLPLFEDEW